MRSLNGRNPIAVMIYYLSVIGIIMFSQNPILLFLTVISIVAYACAREKKLHGRDIAFYIFLFASMSLINPIFSHNGETVLFFVNDTRITLESLIYGVVSACGIGCTLVLFRFFTDIMTKDKLLYVFGRLSPRLALILSMGIRYVPYLRTRAREISENRRAIGLHSEDDIFTKLKSKLCVFSALVSIALENGITTADSMAARGYGRYGVRRTHLSLFKFTVHDAVLVSVTALCTVITAVGILCGEVSFVCYPTLRLKEPTFMSYAVYFSYAVLCFIPAILETEERLKWKYLRSKI